MPLQLIIKGGGHEARVAAAQRKVKIQVRSERAKPGQPVYTTALASTDQLEAVMSWFTEQGTAPYPVGTLLFYNYINF